MKYYVLFIWGDIEPILYGPYLTENERDDVAKRLYNEERGENGVFRLDIDGVTPHVSSYSGAFFEEA